MGSLSKVKSENLVHRKKGQLCSCEYQIQNICLVRTKGFVCLTNDIVGEACKVEIVGVITFFHVYNIVDAVFREAFW